MNRIASTFDTLHRGGGKALTLFLTAGFPTIDSTVPIALSLLTSGADILEIGMPFSDPLADGPVIQRSSAVALSNGVTLGTILDDVRSIRKVSDAPIILMGYVNPILAYGSRRFFDDAKQAGVDGLILPELPLEEADLFRKPMVRNALDRILLVAPTTPPERVDAIDRASSGFLYCVSTTGVTGGSARPASERYVSEVKARAKKNPVLVGFGIATADDARRMAQHADGVVIGSALITRLAGNQPVNTLGAWIGEIRRVLTR